MNDIIEVQFDLTPHPGDPRSRRVIWRVPTNAHPHSFVPGRHPKQANPVAACKLQGCALLVVALSDVDAGCVAGQTVLQTARASGVRIPAACEFGCAEPAR
ncbi:hypothetical protein MES5069_270232 [Mesorhizobium escarrei]|uniref:Uncharacterized protein n=1 Tax=Mesorhizobium escarrei TaxID=666018 RepID=A0ABM9DWE4_9HYPH|nr:hypothetical protein MES5069_270232 [Mesorhizobium escarrei]